MDIVVSYPPDMESCFFPEGTFYSEQVLGNSLNKQTMREKTTWQTNGISVH